MNQTNSTAKEPALASRYFDSGLGDLISSTCASRNSSLEIITREATDILRTAIVLANEREAHPPTIEELARTQGISNRKVYKLFGDVKNLRRLMLVVAWQDIWTEINHSYVAKLGESLTFREDLIRIFSHLISLLDDPLLGQIFDFVIVTERRPLIFAAFDGTEAVHRQRARNLIHSLCERSVNEGEIASGEPPECLADELWNGFYGTFGAHRLVAAFNGGDFQLEVANSNMTSLMSKVFDGKIVPSDT